MVAKNRQKLTAYLAISIRCHPLEVFHFQFALIPDLRYNA